VTPVCQRCGTELVQFGEPDEEGMVTMICPASPLCTEEVRTRKLVGRPDKEGAP
jgi:hypothetical protein